jgi:putative ABC transport system permease protein
VVLGYNYQFDKKIFDKALSLNDKVLINDIEFEIVGFYGEVGTPEDDSHAYITSEAFESLFPEQKDKFGYVIAKADAGVNPELLADKIQEKLRKFKDQEKGKEDFYVQTFADILQTFGNIISILNGVLLLIAFVSMIVAFVNIMNTMYTAVLERTNEIGIMKAVGARNSDILFVFVLESGLLGMVGGIIGVISGYAIAKIGGAFAAAYGYSMLKPIFPWYLVLGCILFSFIVGAVAGLLPAYNASKLKPVDSLRYE